MIERSLSRWRSTMGLCIGVRDQLTTAIVVLSWRRDRQPREMYVIHEKELPSVDAETLRTELKFARETWHPSLTVGYHGASDDDGIFGALSVRLGTHIEQAPADRLVPVRFLAAEFAAGRLKVSSAGLIARDAQTAVWRSGAPGQTGPLAALCCAFWASQQLRDRAPRKELTEEEKESKSWRERNLRKSRPF